MNQKPIINCHTHIFIGENVAPEIAKTILPFPMYKIITIPLIVKICRFWFTSKYSPYVFRFSFRFTFTKLQKINLWFRNLWQSNFVVNFIYKTIGLIIVIYATYFIAQFFLEIDVNFLNKYQDIFLEKINFPYQDLNIFKLIIIICSIVFIPIGRHLALVVLKASKKIPSLLFDKKYIDFAMRYINIGRYAYYKNQATIFSKLRQQYPKNTKFIVLPMDMQFMEAGTTSAKGNYKSQMEELKKIKNGSFGQQILPFIFIDPRRIEIDQNKIDSVLEQPFFKWTTTNGKVILGECFIKEYIEKEKFSGFKIYPALGYFPFDEKLLPLWKYAADNGIPITTHCIKGTIYYRGKKQKQWNYHQVFKQRINSNPAEFKNLFLPSQNNADFSNDFNHPLNYLCLLNPLLFNELVAQSSQEIKDLFEYNSNNKTVKHNLSHLKICLAHFGGDDQWKNFLNSDRYNYAQQLIKKPDFGITFIKKENLTKSHGTLENIWKHVDWYSIICSLMLQYDNVYADISYIIHDTEIFPLLKQTLNNEKLKPKVLFGTDFYVVRNHLTEKEMLVNTMFNLSEEEFDCIARDNPDKFLNQTVG